MLIPFFRSCFLFIRFVYINVTSFIIVAITVVFMLFFLLSSFLCPFHFDCYHHLLHSNSFFFCLVLPLDRRNILRHRSILSHNIFVYFFFVLKVFYDNIDIHLRCCCFQYILFSNFFLLFSFYFNNILFKLFISFLQVVIFINGSSIFFFYWLNQRWILINCFIFLFFNFRIAFLISFVSFIISLFFDEEDWYVVFLTFIIFIVLFVL